MPITMDKKIKGLTPEQKQEIKHRADFGEVQYLWEIAAITGYAYKTLMKWNAQGLPLVDGKINAWEAIKWRKRYLNVQKYRNRKKVDQEIIEIEATARRLVPDDESRSEIKNMAKEFVGLSR